MFACDSLQFVFETLVSLNHTRICQSLAQEIASASVPQGRRIQYHEAYSLVHTNNISIRVRSMRKQSTISPLELTKTKQQELLFVSSFVRLLASVA